MIYAVKRVARNTLFFTVALVIQKIFSFSYFALLARFLGVLDLGVYTFVLSFTTIFTIFIDFGLTPVLTRTIAKDNSDWENVFFNVISIKIFLAVLIYIIVLLFIYGLGYNLIILKLVAISGIVMMLDSFTLTFWGIFRGKHILSYESIANIVVQIIMISIGFIVLFTSKNLFLLIGAHLAAAIFHFLYALSLLIRKMNIRPRLMLNKKILTTTFSDAIPFGLSAIFNRVYSYIDTVFLTKMVGETALGYYSVSYRLLFALQFIPMAFSASIFPAMSSYYQKDHMVLARIFERSSHYLFLIAVPISLGIFTISEKLILAIYGLAYLPSVRVLEILILALIFLFANFPVGAYLNATQRQKINTINQAVGMVISLLINFFLVPKWSFIGSAVAFLVSTIVQYILGMFWVIKTIQLDYYYLFSKTGRTLLAAILMAVFTFYVQERLHLMGVIIFSSIVYIAFLFILRIVNHKELKQLIQSLRPL